MKMTSLFCGLVLIFGMSASAMASAPVPITPLHDFGPTNLIKDSGTVTMAFVGGVPVLGTHTYYSEINFRVNKQGKDLGQYMCSGLATDKGIGNTIESLSTTGNEHLIDAPWYSEVPSVMAALTAMPHDTLEMVMSRGPNRAGRMDIVDVKTGQQLLHTDFQYAASDYDNNDLFNMVTAPSTTTCIKYSNGQKPDGLKRFLR